MSLARTTHVTEEIGRVFRVGEGLEKILQKTELSCISTMVRNSKVRFSLSIMTHVSAYTFDLME